MMNMTQALPNLLGRVNGTSSTEEHEAWPKNTLLYRLSEKVDLGQLSQIDPDSSARTVVQKTSLSRAHLPPACIIGETFGSYAVEATSSQSSYKVVKKGNYTVEHFRDEIDALNYWNTLSSLNAWVLFVQDPDLTWRAVKEYGMLHAIEEIKEWHRRKSLQELAKNAVSASKQIPPSHCVGVSNSVAAGMVVPIATTSASVDSLSDLEQTILEEAESHYEHSHAMPVNLPVVPAQPLSQVVSDAPESSSCAEDPTSGDKSESHVALPCESDNSLSDLRFDLPNDSTGSEVKEPMNNAAGCQSCASASRQSVVNFHWLAAVDTVDMKQKDHFDFVAGHMESAMETLPMTQR